MQPIVAGNEYRVFLLDDEVLFTARKQPPSVVGDGTSSIRDLLTAHNDALRVPRPFAGFASITTPHSTPCCPRASAGRFPGG